MQPLIFFKYLSFSVSGFEATHGQCLTINLTPISPPPVSTMPFYSSKLCLWAYLYSSSSWLLSLTINYLYTSVNVHFTEYYQSTWTRLENAQWNIKFMFMSMFLRVTIFCGYYFCRLVQKHKILYPLTLGIHTIEC